MSYVVATGLLASNCLMAMQGVSPGRSRETQATKTCPIDWLADRRSEGSRHGTYTYRIG